MTLAVSSDHLAAAPACAYGTPDFAPVPPAAVRKPRVVFLDVIRGIAALMVLLQHTGEVVHQPFLFWTFRWINFGRVGVAAFFLVSGFVIPYSLERVNSLKHFWVSRFFRLYPLYWFSLALVVLFHFAGNTTMTAEYEAHWKKVVLVNITMFQELLHKPDAVGLYWTLTLEMVFYIIFSALFALGINKKTMLWAWLGLGVMLAGGVISEISHHKIPTARIGLLSLALIGTAAFRYYSGLISKKQLCFLAIASVIVFAVTFNLGFRGPMQTSDAMEEWSSVSMFSSHALAAVLFATIFLFRSREFPFALRWLGTISYSVYLLHYPVWLTLLWVPHHGIVAGPLWQLLVVAVTCAAASVTYLFIEKPAVQIGKQLLA